MKKYTGFVDRNGKKIYVGDKLLRLDSLRINNICKDREIEIYEENGIFMWKSDATPRTEILSEEYPTKFIEERRVYLPDGQSCGVGKNVPDGNKKLFLEKINTSIE